MKRFVSLLLATLMIVALVPALFVATSAEGEATSKYVVYSEDFEKLELKADSAAILNTLGWYVPAEKASESIATYGVVTSSGNQSLRISTIAKNAAQAANESFLTIIDGDIMSLVKKSDFTLSYDLTYRAGTTNADGYSAVIYNYNESGYTNVVDGLPASYGIAAVRACGAGFNNVYYSVFDKSEFAYLEGASNTGANVMSNNFLEAGLGASLYKRIAASVGDDSYTEAEGDLMSGVVRMIDKTITVKLEYSYADGVTVYVNDILVSKTATNRWASKYDAATVWDDFISRTTGTALGIVTQANIVADIDNIKLEADQIVSEAVYGTKLPELLITEIAPSGYNRTWGNYSFAEYVEIYNPSDEPVDLSKYSLMLGSAPSGTEAEKLPTANPQKYSYTVNLGDYLGNDVVSKTEYYMSQDALASYDDLANPTRFIYVDGDVNARYLQKDGKWVRDDENGTVCRIKYVDIWNSRYQKSNNKDPLKYGYNTLLNPGDTCLIFFIYDVSSHADYWQWGTNAGSTNTSIPDEKCFRQAYGKALGGYSGFGLTENTKVIATNAFNLADNMNYRFYLAESTDASAMPIDYKSVYIGSPTHDRYLVSWCDFNTSIATGVVYEGEDPNNGNFNKSGNFQSNYTALYIYGVDASSDPRAGTLYTTHDKMGVSYSNVGFIIEHQRIVLDRMYKKNDSGKTPELMITEIVPRTSNLVGEDLNAFSAMELTNTSNEALNLYEYALLRTEISANGYSNYIPTGSGFTRYTLMVAGNPVVRGEGNGAYYYFVDNAISNPETCVLAPGESVVIWMLTDGTFQAYQNDEDFSFEYFRQYWVNNGNSQLALKDNNGNYVTKVIAVDANVSVTNNIDNASRVLDADPFFSALYGITRTDRNMKLGLRGKIKSENVVSFAFLGSSASQYKLAGKEIINATGAYYGKILTRSFPVNASVHYVTGVSAIKNCSSLADTLKVQSWSASAGVDIQTHCGVKAAHLGVLDNEEIIAFKDKIFTSHTAAGSTETIHRYYDANSIHAYMLEGAVLDMSGNNPALRFDMAIPESTYYSLIGTYGDRAEIGIAIMETERLDGRTSFTAEQMSAVIKNGVDCRIISRNNGFVVLSAWVPVSNYNYETSYSAIGYISVELDDGTMVNVAANGIVSRSVYEIATAALEDVAYQQSAEYSYYVEEGVYSRYNDEMRLKMTIYTA